MIVIDFKKVGEVLLSDGWHKVLDHSFRMDTCQLGVRDTAGDKVPYWSESVSWEEEKSTGTADICIITVPLHSVLAIRQQKT